MVRRGDLKDQRRDLATRFLRAVIEGNYLALTDAKRAKQVLARELKIKNQTIIDISYDDFKAQSPPDMTISMPGVENVLKLSAGDGSRNADDYIDGVVLMELRKSGFFETMQKKYGKL